MFTQRYIDLKYISGGKFGRVISAIDSAKENLRVAVKIIDLHFHRKDEYKRIFREMDILNHLNSNYCLSLMNAFKTVKDEHLVEVRFVMPLMDFDLKTVMIRYNLTYIQIIKIMYQILMALKYLYLAGIIHRDLKPSNIGLNVNMSLRLLDFGLAREIGGDMTEYVVTRWYRPIEVFCGSDYTTAVDIWSAGCIYAELLLKRVLFKGDNQIDQIAKIIQVTGFPDVKMLSLVHNENIVLGIKLYEGLASKTNILEKHIRSGIEDFVYEEVQGDEECCDNVVNLICKMLELDFRNRITPEEALRSILFEKHKTQINMYEDDYPPGKYFFNFNLNDESDESLQQHLIKNVENFKESF